MTLDIFEYVYFAALVGCTVVTSEIRHTGIRRTLNFFQSMFTKVTFGSKRASTELLCNIPMYYKHWSSQKAHIYLKMTYESSLT